MTTNPTSSEVAVTQADRDIAAEFTQRSHGELAGYTFSAKYMIRNGHWDSDPLVQAFAHHRLSTRPAATPAADVVENVEQYALSSLHRVQHSRDDWPVSPRPGESIIAWAAECLTALTSTPEPFGFWIDQKGAEPVLLRKPAYIPEPSELRTITPLFTLPPRKAQSEANPVPSGDVVEAVNAFMDARIARLSEIATEWHHDKKMREFALGEVCAVAEDLSAHLAALTPAPDSAPDGLALELTRAIARVAASQTIGQEENRLESLGSLVFRHRDAILTALSDANTVAALREARLNLALARLNWRKYENEPDELVYQANKMASAIDAIDAIKGADHGR